MSSQLITVQDTVNALTSKMTDHDIGKLNYAPLLSLVTNEFCYPLNSKDSGSLIC